MWTEAQIDKASNCGGRVAEHIAAISRLGRLIAIDIKAAEKKNHSRVAKRLKADHKLLGGVASSDLAGPHASIAPWGMPEVRHAMGAREFAVRQVQNLKPEGKMAKAAQALWSREHGVHTDRGARALGNVHRSFKPSICMLAGRCICSGVGYVLELAQRNLVSMLWRVAPVKSALRRALVTSSVFLSLNGVMWNIALMYTNPRGATLWKMLPQSSIFGRTRVRPQVHKDGQPCIMDDLGMLSTVSLAEPLPCESLMLVCFKCALTEDWHPAARLTIEPIDRHGSRLSTRAF